MTTTALLTADAFHELATRTDERMELVRGEVRVMSPASAVHGHVAGLVFLRLAQHVERHGLGWCFTEATGFRLAIPGDEEDSVRAPDVSFVSRARLPELPATGFCPVAPDLAVEVLSPDQTAEDVLERWRDHLAAGTRLFWIVDPRARTVSVHAPDGPTRWLREGGALDGGEVVPGLAIPVAALFAGVPRRAR